MGVREADSFPSPALPSCSNPPPPFLPQAGAGHFVQILVNTPPRPPLCRDLSRSCRFLSYYTPTLLLSAPSPAACRPINLGESPLPHADPGLFLPCPHLRLR